ncbi:MAG TPA: hypothetical protein VK944_08270 [Candidatus Limnocylindria bacterium]|nr:hypothetical protein [Candidatus Limnocylindria bacterium]
MARGKEKGEAFVVMLAFMLASGLVLWLATGSFHMMPVHGKKGMHMGDFSPATDGPRRDFSAPPPGVEENAPERAVGPGSRRDDTDTVAAHDHGARIPDSLHWIGSPEPDRKEGMPRGAGGINPVENT